MKKFFLIFLLASSLSFCSKHSETKDDSSHPGTSTESIQDQLDQFKPSVSIRKVSTLDISTFLEIYMSFMENQIVWLRDSASQIAEGPAEDSEETLNKDVQSALKAQAKQKADFFQKWGISYTEFDQFSLVHSQEIQDYLTSHPDEQKKIENLDRFLSSIQNSNASQSDDYYYKDENSIIDQTTQQEENSLRASENSTSSPEASSSDEEASTKGTKASRPPTKDTHL